MKLSVSASLLLLVHGEEQLKRRPDVPGRERIRVHRVPIGLHTEVDGLFTQLERLLDAAADRDGQ